MRARRPNGYSITELLTVVAILGLFASTAMPSFLTLQRRAAVTAAADELRAIFRGCRMRAIASGRNCGVQFTKTNGVWMYAIVDDTNDNGIRTAEIANGTDRIIGRRKRVLETVRYASIGLPPQTIIDPDGEKLTPSSPPVRFGSSSICSFSPLGAATAGSVYLTDSRGEVWCARVFGVTAKVRLMRYAGGKTWFER